MEVWESAVREICSMPILLWLAFKDKKEMKIKRKTLVIATMGLLFAGSFGSVELWNRLAGAAFGVILLLFCFFSQEAMGLADGIIILACGIAFGVQETVTLCFFGALYAGLFSAVLLFSHRVGRKSRIPFLPFLLLGYITMAVMLHSM